jgi:hypothetical protein
MDTPSPLPGACPPGGGEKGGEIGGAPWIGEERESGISTIMRQNIEEKPCREEDLIGHISLLLIRSFLMR